MTTATLDPSKIALRRQEPSQTHVLATRITIAGKHATRYGLVLLLVWMGGMKFTAYEAEAISGLVSNSPLLAWVYSIFSTTQFGVVLGTTELLIAALIAARPFSANLSALGSGLAIGMFLVTLSFMASTPGVVEPSLGFPALSVLPGQLLLKDVVLLAVAVWTLGEALSSASQDEK